MEPTPIKTAEDAKRLMKFGTLNLFRNKISEAALECKCFIDIQFPDGCSSSMAEEIKAMLSDDGFTVQTYSGCDQIRILWR